MNADGTIQIQLSYLCKSDFHLWQNEFLRAFRGLERSGRFDCAHHRRFDWGLGGDKLGRSGLQFCYRLKRFHKRRISMHDEGITIPEVAMIAGTRAILGAGIGLLVADHLRPENRRTAGWTLVAVGVLTTFPLVADMLLKRGFCRRSGSRSEHCVEESASEV
jgi:hypothetical protein